jgi:hypothetical protein
MSTYEIVYYDINEYWGTRKVYDVDTPEAAIQQVRQAKMDVGPIEICVVARVIPEVLRSSARPS